MKIFELIAALLGANSKNIFLNAPSAYALRGNKYPTPHQGSREILRRQLQSQRVVAVRKNADGTVSVREMNAWLANSWLANHSGTAVPLADLQAFNDFNDNAEVVQ